MKLCERQKTYNDLKSFYLDGVFLIMLMAQSGMQSSFQRNRVVLLHVSFWLVYLSFFFYQISTYRRGADRGSDFSWSGVLTTVSIQVSMAFIISYLNYFYFLPRFLKRKNVWIYLLEFSIPFVLIMMARLHLERYFLDGYTHQREHLYSDRFIIQVVTINLFIVIFVAMLRFAVDWFEFEAKQKAAENEKLTAELNFLKAQINPHFLFNTLNNLYYLAYTQSANTTEVIAKLSQMMRYMIYDSNHIQVPLSKEIEYMESYISLERLRLNNEIPIAFEVTGDAERALIAPLILITFLENAFKHGVNNSYPGAWVNIKINVRENSCLYSVENSKVPVTTEQEGKSGIGLQNVHRRLALSYPNQYTLTVDDQTDRYIVNLNIKLS